MSQPGVLSETRGPVGIVTVNRPEVMNALDLAHLALIETALTAMEEDPAIHVIVLTGAGERAFVAGADIADIETRDGLASYGEFLEAVHRVARRIEVSDKPTIAAVNGLALGGGAELVLAADIRILADGARIGLPEIKLGLFPGAGGTQRLPRQIPLCRAKEMMFTGEPIGADEAVALGLANRVVPADRLMDEVMALAGRIAEKSPLTLKMLKRTILRGLDMPLSAALPYEQAMAALLFDSEDAHEGCRAFLERRAPGFVGR